MQNRISNIEYRLTSSPDFWLLAFQEIGHQFGKLFGLLLEGEMAGVLDDGELRVWESIAVETAGGFALQVVCAVDDQHRGCDLF